MRLRAWDNNLLIYCLPLEFSYLADICHHKSHPEAGSDYMRRTGS
jgi:hypothetical protein